MCHNLTTVLCGIIFAVIFENKCNRLLFGDFRRSSNCNETRILMNGIFFQCDRYARIDSWQRRL